MKLGNLKNKPACNVTRSITGRNICILGLGIENYALVKFLLKDKSFAGAQDDKIEITVCDARSKKELGDKFKNLSETHNNASVQWKLGKNYDKGLGKYDIVFRSPGYPLFSFKKIKSPPPPFNKGGTIVSSPMKLFFELSPSKNIIGVTGTKGKGTTSALIYNILKSAKKRVWLGGNIGVAPFEFIGKIKKNDWVILELSSFQLEDMKMSPKIAVITNFYKEHLSSADPNNPNYHLSLKEYWKAKINIVKYQKRGDKVVVNIKLKAQISKLKTITQNSKVIYFDKSELPSKLVGEHNKENIAAAVEVAKIVGMKKSIIEKAVKNYKGLPHRLELIKKIKILFKIPLNPPLLKGAKGEGGFIKYYNDSFATTPESTIIALQSFNNPIILIAGGAEKKSDFKKLAKVIKIQVKYVILLNGKATPRLKKEILKTRFLGKNIKLVYNIKEAVKLAKKNSESGDVILLSPACASFGMFKNYKERGDLFKKEVKK